MDGVHRVSPAGDFRWGNVGFSEGGKERSGERGVWAGRPAPEPPCFLACWGHESGIGTLLPFVVVSLGLGLRLIALFGALPLWLLGFASLFVGARAIALETS